MNPYHSLTDDQLAEWHQLVTKVDRLTADLAESRKATESVQAAAEDERRKLLAELNRRGDSIAKMGLDNVNALNMVRQHAAALVEALKALRALRDTMLSDAVLVHQTQWPREVFLTLEHAEDVLKKYDIPF